MREKPIKNKRKPTPRGKTRNREPRPLLDNNIYTVEQAAAILQISVDKMRNVCKHNEIKHSRIGRDIRIFGGDIRGLMVSKIIE